MLKRIAPWTLAFASLTLLAPVPALAAPTISAGAALTTVPTYITLTLAANQFLLPVEITDAAGLQTWQFDVTFDKTVVQEVDPGDGTSGIYGAEFASGDADSLSSILNGLPVNDQGLVDDVAGSYPFLFDGVSGDGTLAYILFEYQPDQAGNDPNFGIEDATTTQSVPEPATLALLAGGLAALSGLRRRPLRGCQE